MSAKKRVRFSETPDVREFETETKKPKNELDPMEALEGGINAVCIYEGGASMDPASAAAQRARQRKDNLMARFEEGASFLGSIEAVEAAYEDPEEMFNDAGIPIEPFHLKREREEGYFDEAGTYVEYKTDDVEDNWVDSLADVEVDEGWLARIRTAQQTQANEEEPADDLDADELRAFKQRLSDLLQPRETTLQALRRLGQLRVERTGADASGDAEHPAHRKPQQVMPSPVQHTFDRLTEYSSLLMEHGEYGIHSQTKEQIQRSLLADASEGADGAGALDDNVKGKATVAAEAGRLASNDGAAVETGGEGEQRMDGGDLGAAGVGGRPPLLELAGPGSSKDAGALLAQQLLAGAGVSGGLEDRNDLRRRSSVHDMPAGILAEPADRVAAEEEAELDIFADEDDPTMERPPAAGGSAAGQDAKGEESNSLGKVSRGSRSRDVDMRSADDENAAPGQHAQAADSQAASESTAGTDPAGIGSAAPSQPSGQGSPALPPQRAQGKQGIHQLEGFEFDPSSGFWYNTNLGCYYDPTNQLYGDAVSGSWFKYSEGEYQPVSI